MKKVVFYMMLLVMSIGYAYAQGKADIKFEQTTHDFGTFSENSPVVSYTFNFTNIGDAPLGNPSGCSFLRMYSSRIFTRTDSTGKEWNSESNL